jgi:hypothetical protein
MSISISKILAIFQVFIEKDNYEKYQYGNYGFKEDYTDGISI